MYETAKETLMYRTVLWTLWERERVSVPGILQASILEGVAMSFFNA